MKKHLLALPIMFALLIPAVSLGDINYSRTDNSDVLNISVKADSSDNLIEPYCAPLSENACGNLKYWEILVTQIVGFDEYNNAIYQYYNSPAYAIDDLNESYSFTVPGGNYNLIQIAASTDNLLNSNGTFTNSASLLNLESSNNYNALPAITYTPPITDMPAATNAPPADILQTTSPSNDLP